MGITTIEKNKRIAPDSHLTWRLPQGWSFEDGASATLSHALVSV